MKRYLYVALAMMLAMSCHPEPMLEVSVTEMAFAIEGSEATATVTSNYPWTASFSDDWYTVSPSSGEKGTTVLTVRASANRTYGVRSSTLTISSEGLNSVISIAQDCDKLISLSLDGGEEKASVPYRGGTVTVHVSSNVNYQVTPADSWVHQVESKGLEESTVYLYVDPNEKTETRETTVTFEDFSTDTDAILHISQDARGYSYTLIHTLSAFNLPAFTGEDMSGTVSWGDGMSAAYAAGMQHTYQTGEEHTVTAEFKGPVDIALDSLTGIKSISLPGM